MTTSLNRIAARWLSAKDETEWHVAYMLKGTRAVYGDSDHKTEQAAKSSARALVKMYPNSTAVFYYERDRKTLGPVGPAVDVKGKAPKLASGNVVAARWLHKCASMENGKLDQKLRRQINGKLNRAGLDGNGRFRSAQRGYAKAVEVLAEFHIELDMVVSSHLFNMPTGTLKVDMAYSHPTDPFSPVSITNSILYIQYAELRDDVYEIVAYMS